MRGNANEKNYAARLVNNICVHGSGFYLSGANQADNFNQIAIASDG